MKTLYLLLLLAIATRPLAPKDKGDICEAVIRYDAAHNSASTGLYFVDFDGGNAPRYRTDPDDSFLKRFTNGKLRVKKGSEAGSGPTNPVIDSKTGKPGTHAGFGVITVTDGMDAKLDCAMISSGQGAHGWEFKLMRTADRWKVISAKTISLL